MFALVASTGPSVRSEAGAQQDTIAILEVAPAAGVELDPGREVTFDATLDYSLLSSSSGAIYFMVQDQDNRRLTKPGPQVHTAVSRGQGSVRLSGHVMIPATGVREVRLFFALVPPGPETHRTQVVATTRYPVAQTGSRG